MPARKTKAGAQKCVTQRVKKMPAVGPPAGTPGIHAHVVDGHQHHHDAANDVERRDAQVRVAVSV